MTANAAQRSAAFWYSGGRTVRTTGAIVWDAVEFDARRVEHHFFAVVKGELLVDRIVICVVVIKAFYSAGDGAGDHRWR